MVNKVLAAFVAVDGLFVSMGAIMLGFAVIVQQKAFDAPSDGHDAARNLLYQKFPFTGEEDYAGGRNKAGDLAVANVSSAGIANAILTFIVFVATLPALATNNRGWLKFAGYLVVADAVFTMAIGLDLWIVTLKMKDEFSSIWTSQNAGIQDMMQTTFSCCGFNNSTSPAFVTDGTCPSPAAAALMPGCAASLVSFGSTFVDNIFTAVFGMVGIDVLLVMTMACLLKDRKERERFRYIDEKTGARSTF
ncbi:hypothetical protein F4779DRAFT_621659 [Xylariaceae sp. FL0662B]|nr:hypothetical protein F4779DRAFT_621659 [Xylariaceae sp. FL0662B]